MQVRHGDPIGRLFMDTRHVVLSKDEWATLVKARDICEKADDLERKIAECPDPDNAYNIAYVGLAEIVGASR